MIAIKIRPIKVLHETGQDAAVQRLESRFSITVESFRRP